MLRMFFFFFYSVKLEEKDHLIMLYLDINNDLTLFPKTFFFNEHKKKRKED